MRKENFLEKPINRAIQRLILEAGFIEIILKGYERPSGSMVPEEGGHYEGDADSDQWVSALSTRNLEGAYALYAMGVVSGVFVFILELLYHYSFKLYQFRFKA